MASKALKVSPFGFAKTFLKVMMQKPVEQRLWGPSNIRVTSATPHTIKFEMEVLEQQTNSEGYIHGTSLISLLDLAGKLAIVSSGRWSMGEPTDMNISFGKPLFKAGDLLKVIVESNRYGDAMAFSTIKFTNISGVTAARGSHTRHLTRRSKISGYVVPEEFASLVDSEDIVTEEQKSDSAATEDSDAAAIEEDSDAAAIEEDSDVAATEKKTDAE